MASWLDEEEGRHVRPMGDEEHEEVDVPLPGSSSVTAGPREERSGSLHTLSLEETKHASPQHSPSRGARGTTFSSSWEVTEGATKEGDAKGVRQRAWLPGGLAWEKGLGVKDCCTRTGEALTPGEGMGWMSLALIIESANMSVLYWLMHTMEPSHSFRPASFLAASTLLTLLLSLLLFRKDLNMDSFRTVAAREWPWVLLSGVIGPAASSYLTVKGLYRTSVPTAAIITRFDTFFLLVLPPTISRSLFRPLPMLCAAALLSALFVTAFDHAPNDSDRFATGVALLFGGALFSALDQALLRAKLSHMSVGVTTVAKLAIATVFMHLVTALHQHRISQAYAPKLWAMCAWYVPVFVFVTRSFWYRSVRKGQTSATRAWAPLMMLVMNFGWSTMVFGQPAGREMIGMTLTIVALVSGVLDRRASGQYRLEDQRRAMDREEAGGLGREVVQGLEASARRPCWQACLAPALNVRDVGVVSDRELPDRFV